MMLVLIHPRSEVFGGVDVAAKVVRVILNKGRATGERLVGHVFPWTPFAESNPAVKRAGPYQYRLRAGSIGVVMFELKTKRYLEHLNLDVSNVHGMQ